jgi:predicted N-acetyltransferase YhbS
MPQDTASFEWPFKLGRASGKSRYPAGMAAVERATEDRVPELAALLGRAFADDPMFLWPLGSDAIEAKATAFFLAFDLRLSALGWLWATSTGDGVAAWIPPGEDEAMMDIDRELRPKIARVTEDGGARYEAMWEWIASRLPEEPFWYLDHLAVDAASRRSGLGTALIRHGLDLADRDGVPAFLETARVGNVDYYERRGFRVVADADVPGGGPHLWFLRYEPGSSRSSSRASAVGSSPEPS